MRHHIRAFTTRHEPQGALSAHLKSGLGALLGILLVGGLAVATALPLLVAPLGATVVLLFGQPNSPLSQPMSVFGGYLIGTIAGSRLLLLFPVSGGSRRSRSGWR